MITKVLRSNFEPSRRSFRGKENKSGYLLNEFFRFQRKILIFVYEFLRWSMRIEMRSIFTASCLIINAIEWSSSFHIFLIHIEPAIFQYLSEKFDFINLFEKLLSKNSCRTVQFEDVEGRKRFLVSSSVAIALKSINKSFCFISQRKCFAQRLKIFRRLIEIM